MSFAVAMVVLFALFAIGIVMLGLFHPKSGAEVLRWQPTRAPEQEDLDQLEDLHQLLEATNAKRRARGMPERTADDVENELRGG